MGIITKYKFNQNTYANFIPTFNSGFTYTITDEIDTDGYTIRTIESDNLPTSIRFGTNGSSATNREESLLEVYECNTSQVTNMSYMFSHCSKLTSLDLLNFNTEKVTNMSYMFYLCSSLTSLNISNFNTSQVVYMGYMFYGCSSLTSLDLSNFDVQNVENCTFTFADCKSLQVLNLSNFKVLSNCDLSFLVSGCESLELLDISNIDIVESNNINGFFQLTPKLVNIGLIYASSLSINYMISRISPLNIVNIWYSNANINNLAKKDNVIYKEYKMNILESDEEINLRRIGDVYDELNLETGEYIQRINEIMLDENISWGQEGINEYGIRTGWYIPSFDSKRGGKVICDKTFITGDNVEVEGIRMAVSGGIYIQIKDTGITIKEWLKSNPLILQYEVMTPVIKTINLKGKPSINWQGDTYLHLENNTLYPQLECEIESINYYEIPKLKANTLYTLRYVGEPTQCIFGGLTYKTENNMILTSGSSDNLLYFDKEVRKVVLIEGDVRDRNFDYFKGIESLGAVEIVTHKTNMPIFAKGGRK